MSDYNGWKNRATWSVAMNINGGAGEWLYRAAVEFMRANPAPRTPYKSFVMHMGLWDDRTAEGFKYLSKSLDYKELNDMMREMV